MDLIRLYEKSFIFLNQYDENRLIKPAGEKPKFILDYNKAKNEILKLKNFLMGKQEASELFGLEKDNGFKGLIKNIYQTFNGVDLLPSIEEKAANLLYYIIKDHPFVDGNKRIGAFLFVLFLEKNNHLYDENNNLKINPNGLVSLTLFIANSKPEEKELIVKLIMNLIKKFI